jgi:hypothetical protein
MVAWLKLREALDLASALGLNHPESYRDLSEDKKSQRLRTYLVLSIAERYALNLASPQKRSRIDANPTIGHTLSSDFIQ